MAGIVGTAIGATKIVYDASMYAIRKIREPKLKIEKVYVQDFAFPLARSERYIRRFIIATVKNNGGRIAERCMGYLESEQTAQKELSYIGQILHTAL